MSEIDNKKRAPAWLGVLSFLAYSSFFLFLMYRYGYSNTDTSWIKELNYSFIQICATILILFYLIDEYLKKQKKSSFWFDYAYDLVSACVIGMSIAFPLFIIILFNF
ncbi:hypothetical protein [Moraxella equi]|nr:hypothetical protein [Moraxella equi]